MVCRSLSLSELPDFFLHKPLFLAALRNLFKERLILHQRNLPKNFRTGFGGLGTCSLNQNNPTHMKLGIRDPIHLPSRLKNHASCAFLAAQLDGLSTALLRAAALASLLNLL